MKILSEELEYIKCDLIIELIVKFSNMYFL